MARRPRISPLSTSSGPTFRSSPATRPARSARRSPGSFSRWIGSSSPRSLRCSPSWMFPPRIPSGSGSPPPRGAPRPPPGAKRPPPLLVNYRPEYQHGWGGKTYYHQLRIDPLPPENAEELLDALLGNDAGLQPLKRLLIERTEGNPFFLEESVRTLVETQVLSGERGAYRLGGG